MKNCELCGTEMENKRDSAKYCSTKCRVTASRSVTLTNENVTLSEPVVTPTYKFTIKHKKDDPMAEAKSRVREAKYWYDVPLAAVPVLQKGWEEMPDFMNGRQYFLWWKNGFKVNDGVPEILNPFPKYDKLMYVGGPQSKFWGA